MKLRNLVLGMMTCAAFTACTSDDIVDNNGGGNKIEGDAFVALNISMVGDITTRATEGSEIDGTPAENGISDIAILFYNGETLIQTVTKTDLASMNGGSITDFTQAMIVLKNPGIVPTSVVAVLNPSATNFPTTLSALKTKTDYALNSSADNKFAMTNSTFVKADGSVQMEVPVSAANVTTDPTTAKANPVQIYVERALAKVAPKKGGNFKVTLDKNSSKINVDGNPETLTADIIGWNLSGTNKTSFILKNFDAAWNNLSWAKGTNRTFWAKDANYAAGSTTQNDLNFETFPTTTPAGLYCLENTLDNYATNNLAATHLLVGAQIKVNGTAVTLYDYLGQKYTETGVKNLMSTNSNISKYYVEDPSGTETVGGKKYVSFKPSYIEFKKSATSSYQVTPTLATTAPSTFYTLSADKKTATPVNRADVVAAVEKLGDVDKYSDGKCYYYVSIEHFGTAGLGEVGIVRNHVYNLSINSITGFGTPVPNPDETIIPEKPEKNDYYVAAKVEILKWKGVSQDVDLE